MRKAILLFDMSALLPVPAESALVEAARHALLRRLAPSLRHDAVSSLQPIALAGGVLERRLQSPSPDLAAVGSAVHQLIDCSRHAVQSCLDVIAWLGLESAHDIPLEQAVSQAVTLLQGSFGFRGFSLRVEGTGDATPVAGSRLRYILPACLLWLSDGASAPAELVLHLGKACGPAAADPQPADALALARLQICLVPTPDAPGMHPHAGVAAYRPLREEEINALAQAEDVRLAWSGDCLALTLMR